MGLPRSHNEPFAIKNRTKKLEESVIMRESKTANDILKRTAIGTMVLCATIWYAGAATPQDQAQNIMKETGIQGGLVVHVGCGDGKLTSALRVNDSYLVHGLDANPQNVATAREQIQSSGLYGDVTVEQIKNGYLPYVDNSVNLVVGEDLGDVSIDEVMRVLTPDGAAYIRKGGQWATISKARPKGMDEWTHYLYDATNNAVSRDTIVDLPTHIQWIGEPKTARSHDHLSSISAAVSSGGRVFYIADEGSKASLAFPARWSLIARDAFNGVLLWKKPIGPWEGHLRGFRSGPPEVARRLVAVGDRVYVTLGYGKPVTVLDAATGDIVKAYEGTKDTLEIAHRDGILYLVTGEMDIAEVVRRRSASPPPRQKAVLAIEAHTGNRVWSKSNPDTQELMPLTLTVTEDRVFFQNPDNVICLDAGDGSEVWRASRPIQTQRWGWSTPTLAVYENIVLSADRAAPDSTQIEDRPEQVQWDPSSRGGEAPPGELIAFSAENGEELWRCECREAYNAPPDVLVIDGLLWTGDLVHRKDPGITVARSVTSGEIKKERPEDQDFFSFGMGHHRCYRNKATEDYVLLGRSGIEYLDVDSGKVIANHWIRGACQYGIMPANGLTYVPPHSCACFIEAKLNGFLAIAADKYRQQARPNRTNGKRLEKGPAFGRIVEVSGPEIGVEDQWPTYRCDPSRSGRIETAMPTKLENAWKQELGGNLSPPVAAAGKVFVADVDRHTLYALDARTGDIVWSYTAGGRIDSPPTIYRELALFGSADGYVYCLRESDGALVWRFRAAPEDQRIVAYGRLESLWPVHGNILVLEEDWEESPNTGRNTRRPVAYATAGRSSYIDGGIYLYKLDARTGEILAQSCVNHRDPETGLPPQDTARGVNMPGALPDVLSSDGEFIYMRHTRFDRECVKQEPNVPHLFSPAGFLDDSWWHRTYWLYGTDMSSGWGGWTVAGNKRPAGRLLAVDQSTIYGFGRLNQYARHGSHVGVPDPLLPWPPPERADRGRGNTHYELFACAKDPELSEEVIPATDRRGERREENVSSKWSKPIDLVVRAMVLADDTLFIAGPPELLTTPNGPGNIHAAQAAYQGKKGASLWAVSTNNGEKIAEHKLDSPPVLDGMIAANGSWYISTMDGSVVCLGDR